ncbi:MAG: divergent polysaccharide deacetylase family protein [Sulfurospirillaceae bacterium]|nr:divergent polysaccharide deacetylase family protein [Sulfurospirillaceae bacterium]
MVKKQKTKRVKKPYSARKARSRIVFVKKMIFFLLLFFVLPAVIVGSYLYYVNVIEPTPTHKKQKTQAQEQHIASEELMQKMKEMLETEKKRLSTLTLTPQVPKEEKPAITEKPEQIPLPQEEQYAQPEDDTKVNGSYLSEINDYKSSIKDKSESVKKKVIKKIVHGEMPKLAIIIDDVSFDWQAKMIKKIPFKVNPSFFPPTSKHPNTPILSKEFEFSMVHLPLEALSYAHPEVGTLKVGDSVEVITRKIQELKKLFPATSYYNNHTGSRFTSSYDAMDKLVSVMKNENLHFVDSRTSGDSKAPDVFKKYQLNLLSRDIFLDNSIEKSAIKEQLKRAISMAQKNGYAIAIGHPHKNTLEVLRDAKPMLKDINLVYVKELEK